MVAGVVSTRTRFVFEAYMLDGRSECGRCKSPGHDVILAVRNHREDNRDVH